MTVPNLGKTPAANASRDAIHIAVIPMVADRELKPGQRTIYGIVDPFLTCELYTGQRYWLFLYPETVTDVRHQWTHPLFNDAGNPIPRSVEHSEAWLREFCRTHDCPDYETVMAGIKGEIVPEDCTGEGYSYPDYYRCDYDGEYLFFGGKDAHADIPAEFWDHVAIVLGREPPHRPSRFSCSC